MKTIIGIDPGMNGAISIYNEDELEIYDMPTYEIEVGKFKRRKVDPHKLAAILKAPCDHIFIERVWAQPGNGAAGAFTYGHGCGAIEAVTALSGHPYTFVLPGVWKKAMSCPKDKDAARHRASQLLPKFAHCWDLKKWDGRAEASLIALYGFQRT